MLEKKLYISISVFLFFGFFDLNASELHKLVQDSSCQATENFLANCKVREAQSLVNEEDASGRTPLWYAVQRGNKLHSKGDLDIIKLLVKYGANTKWRDSCPRFGRSYLHWTENKKVFRYFLYEADLEKRIPLNIQNNNGDSPLEEARNSGQVVKIKQIFEILTEIYVASACCRLPDIKALTKDMQWLAVK